MSFFDSDNNDKAKERVSSVKKLSEKLNADYYYGVDKLRAKFNLYTNSELKESNAISGKIEDHEYCFVEYYHTKNGKNDSSKWVSNLYMKTKDDTFPNFHLKPKSSTISLAILLIIFASIFFIGSLVLLGTVFFGNVKGGDVISIILLILISLFFNIVSLIIIAINVKTLKKVYGRDPYGINNRVFREKYVIFSEESPEKIRKIFTEKVCAKIIKEAGYDLDIIFVNNVTDDSLNYNEQLSLNSCNKHLNKLLKTIKLFEQDNYYLD